MCSVRSRAQDDAKLKEKLHKACMKLDKEVGPAHSLHITASTASGQKAAGIAVSVLRVVGAEAAPEPDAAFMRPPTAKATISVRSVQRSHGASFFLAFSFSFGLRFGKFLDPRSKIAKCGRNEAECFHSQTLPVGTKRQEGVDSFAATRMHVRNSEYVGGGIAGGGITEKYGTATGSGLWGGRRGDIAGTNSHGRV
ncbi:hypothetical protein RRF57_000996 [Xylaria bambusicola]|uniref:Uncharacterized protein n=1 Tax=Xylaria bambusicola TaxID=326684 RepID=A0AAN7YUM1_9PEZI